MTYVETPINVRAWLDVSRLSISPELIAAKHQFHSTAAKPLNYLKMRAFSNVSRAPG